MKIDNVSVGRYSISLLPVLFIALIAYFGSQIADEQSAMTRRLTAANMQNSRLISENAKLSIQQQPQVTVIVPPEQQQKTAQRGTLQAIY
ncbi:hypothetical protein [Dickeya ananatis]